MKFFLTAACLIVTLIASAQTQSDKDIVARSQTRRITSKAEDRQVTVHVFFGDLNKDGKQDAVAEWCVVPRDEDYDVGGGNALMNMVCWLAGVAVYEKRSGTWQLQTDVNKDDLTIKDALPFDVEKVENGKIYCTATAYADDDARCCPSLTYHAMLEYNDGKLQLSKEPPIVTRKKQ